MRDDELFEEIIEEEPPEKRSNALLITGILLILIIAFMVYILKKRSSAAKAIFMILLFSGIFLSANPALAATAVALVVAPSGEEPNANINWILPLPTPDYFHEAGAYVQYQGDISLSSGKNISDNEIKFFISGNEDVVLKEEGEIWVINEDPAVNPGLIHLGGFEYASSTDKLAYDKIFEIPIAVSHIGEGAARFYLQFQGEHVASGNLRWLIAYREATIQAAGEGGLYISLEPDKTEASVGDEINWTVTINNNLPCMQYKTDVMLIIDISATMGQAGKNGTKLDDAVIAAETFIGLMDSAYNKLGLASYSNDGYLNAALTLDYAEVESEIEALGIINMTCISCGINIANREIIDNGRPEAALYHVLMTDGLANYCISDDSGAIVTGWGCGLGDPSESDAIAQADLSDEADITIYTIGFMVPGSAVDLMEDIADHTDGQYFDAPDAETLEQAYEVIAGLISGNSPATKIEIDIPDELEVTEHDAYCRIEGSKLICDGEGQKGWDLLCGGESGELSLTFTTKIVSGEGQEIEVIATVFNAGGKKKEDTKIIKIVSQPTAEIISPDASSWQTGDFEASFRYVAHVDGPDLAACEYRIESRPEGGEYATTVSWISAGNCSSTEEFLTEGITITVGEGEGKNCRHQGREGQETCRISVRAIDLAGTESAETGDWQKVYHIDWIPPEIKIE